MGWPQWGQPATGGVMGARPQSRPVARTGHYAVGRAAGWPWPRDDRSRSIENLTLRLCGEKETGRTTAETQRRRENSQVTGRETDRDLNRVRSTRAGSLGRDVRLKVSGLLRGYRAK
jgi:hypothetical protein